MAANQEAGGLFSFTVPATGGPPKAQEMRDNFEGLARTHYTTDETKPANPRKGQLRVNAKDPVKVKLQVWNGSTWEDAAIIGAVVVPDDFVTSAVDLTLDDRRYYAFNATLGPRTGQLPKASSVKGRTYSVKKIDASGNSVTLLPFAGDNIEGAPAFVFPAMGNSARITSDGLNTWWVFA